MEKKRIGCFDIAKGIGIILVVWAHARGPFTAYIYLFHMPLFFLISGYLFHAKGSFWDFTVRKIQSLYIPFVFWNLAALGIKLAVGLSHMPAEKAIRTAVKTLLTLEKDGEFFGATWFLSALFLESVLYKACDELLKRLPHRRIFITILFLLGMVFGLSVILPYKLSRTLILGGFFAIGSFVKEYQDRLAVFWKWYLAVLFFVLFAVTGRNGHVNMGMHEYSSPVLFVLGSCMMTYAILYLSKWIDDNKNIVMEKGKDVLCFLGRRSMDILIWQFVFFRVVIALQLFLDHKPVTVRSVLSYYPTYAIGNGWWAVYTAAGIFLPILWCSILKSGIWGKLFQKMHIV